MKQRLRGLSEWPLVVAPMAGGTTTIGLVTAAAGAGAVGLLAGGYGTAEGLAADMADVRAAGVSSFGVNVFVPGRPAADPARVAARVASLAAEASALGVVLGEPTWDDGAHKLEVMLAPPPAAVSFTFGIPGTEVIRSLHAAGSLVVLTVSTPEEAAAALRAEPDASACTAAKPGLTGPAWPTTTSPTRTAPSTRCWQRYGGAPSCRSSPPEGWAGRRTWSTSWLAAPRSCRPAALSCAAPRAVPPRPTRTARPQPASRRRPSREPSAGAGPGRP